MRLAVVSAIWQRPERLPLTLAMLDQQSDGDFDLFLINNNAALVDYVEECTGAYDGAVVVLHNERNRGPFARLEVMHDLAGEYDYFLTVDDDMDIGPHFIASWRKQADGAALQGWRGFRFRGDYWTREAARAGEDCHYLWGSNLCVPSAAVADSGVLSLANSPGYWQCDDLWLCYYANHERDLPLRMADIAASINVDGKDTYLSQHDTKVRFLEVLRAQGWRV